MNILVIGGTGFLSGHFARAAADGGHRVTLWHRGRKSPAKSHVQDHIIGDRAAGLPMDKRHWDAVVDFCGYDGAIVERNAHQLRDCCAHYVFVSSISVYKEPVPSYIDEQSPLVAPSNQNYATCKVGCEQAVLRAFGERATIVRPGLVAGPGDPTCRFSYWLQRVSDGGCFLAPGRPQNPVQYIDVRDLAQWLVHMVEKKIVGTFNATGPAAPLRFDDFLDVIARVTSAWCSWQWVPEEHLLACGIKPWTQLPLWIPKDSLGLLRVSSAQARKVGLATRALDDTIRETHAWLQWGNVKTPATILTRAQERSVLEGWLSRAEAA